MTNTNSKSEKIWIKLFGWIGFLMFVASIFESLVTLFWIGKEVVQMNSFRISFAIFGFIFALANKQLGIFANNIGMKIIDKFHKQ